MRRGRNQEMVVGESTADQVKGFIATVERLGVPELCSSANMLHLKAGLYTGDITWAEFDRGRFQSENILVLHTKDGNNKFIYCVELTHDGWFFSRNPE